MKTLLFIISIVVGYFLGSISFSVILTKFKFKKDVRQEGSGNAGATNVTRVFGMKAGLFTLFGDILKTFASMALGLVLLGEWGMMAAGIAAILGHCFPAYFSFKGGKAVSVTGAVAIFVDLRVAAIGLTIFLLIALITRYVSLSSIIAGSSLVVLAFVFSLSLPKTIILIFAALMIIIMHRANISRLIKGTEPKFKPKSNK